MKRKSGAVAIANCKPVDVVAGKHMDADTVICRNGVIESVRRGIPEGFTGRIIDAKGAFCIPGLIDTHCHPTITPVFGMRSLDIMKHVRQMRRQFELCIESGVTTIRDTGSFPKSLAGFMKDMERDRLKGPRVLRCNSMTNKLGGHPDVPPGDINVFAPVASLLTGMVMANFRDIGELRRFLPKNSKGASFIKLTVDNRSVFPRKDDIPTYTDEELDEIFSFARKSDLPVSCHCHRLWGFRRIMRWEPSTLEHIVSDAFLSDAEIELMAKKRVAITPTLTVGASYLLDEAYDSIPAPYDTEQIRSEVKIRKEYLSSAACARHCDPHLHQTNIDLLKCYRTIGMDSLWAKKKFLINPELYFGMIHYGSQNLLRMKSAGVTIGCAIDAGMPFSYFGGIWRELELFGRIGFTPAETLRCATVNGAKICRMEDRIGTIAEGKSADLVLLNDDPLKSACVYRSPRLVMLEGRVLLDERVASLSQV